MSQSILIQIKNEPIYSDSNCTYIINLYPSEVVGRGSETQLQMGENFNSMM